MLAAAVLQRLINASYNLRAFACCSSSLRIIPVWLRSLPIRKSKQRNHTDEELSACLRLAYTSDWQQGSELLLARNAAAQWLGAFFPRGSMFYSPLVLKL